MTQTQTDLFQQILNHSHIANPYPIYAQLRERPVSRQEDGTYVVSTYNEIAALLHDPRVSSDERKRTIKEGIRGAGLNVSTMDSNIQPPFIFLDPPDHDNFRRTLMTQFTPARVESLRATIQQTVKRLLDAQKDKRQLDVVDDIAYPLPVTVICDLLGVPREDEKRFHEWSTTLASTLDPGQQSTEQELEHARQAAKEMREYMISLIASLSQKPGDNLLSGLLLENQKTNVMNMRELVSNAVMLLIAGHETTVNLITNSMLAMLRNPEAWEQLQRDPELVVTLVEEVLRYDPPVHFRTRTTLADIEIAGTTIPKGAPVVLLLASGSRDPRRFPHPDNFDPRRKDNQHLGFSGGIHYCVGAPLARMETHIVLAELARRIEAPRLTSETITYRDNASLRGPRHLSIQYERIRD